MDIVFALKIIINIYAKNTYLISFKNHVSLLNLTSFVQKFDTLLHETFNILCQSDNYIIKVWLWIYALHRTQGRVSPIFDWNNFDPSKNKQFHIRRQQMPVRLCVVKFNDVFGYIWIKLLDMFWYLNQT